MYTHFSENVGSLILTYFSLGKSLHILTAIFILSRSSKSSDGELYDVTTVRFPLDVVRDPLKFSLPQTRSRTQTIRNEIGAEKSSL